MTLSCLYSPETSPMLRMQSKCLTMACKIPLHIFILVTSHHLPYVDLCTWCSITWNVLYLILAWVTLGLTLRLSEGITPSRKSSPIPLSWMWSTYIHFHAHHSAVLLAS